MYSKIIAGASLRADVETNRPVDRSGMFHVCTHTHILSGEERFFYIPLTRTADDICDCEDGDN